MATPANGIYVLQGIVPSQIAAAPVGVKVVDLYDDNGDLFSSSQVAQMESGGGNVLGYFSIGEAENFRSYWSSLPTSVLGPQNLDWPGDYQVAYWTPQWLTVSENYIQTMINQGYKGAFFDVVDEAETSWAEKNAPNGDAEGAMVTLIQELANYAHARDPSFQIWINSSGAEPMLSNSTLVNTINGAFEEQLFYQDATHTQSSADVNFNLALLDNLVKAGKPVVAVEYVSGASEVSSVETQAKADGIGYYIANPNLQLDGVDTQGFTSGSGSASGSGSTRGTAPAVAITSKGGTTTSAAQTIAGTVDVADAGSTVTVLDGATKIGSATVAATGGWSAKVTLPKQGANVITATDTNAAGTGTSSAVTYTLASAAPTPPTLTIANATLSVTGRGGTAGLGIRVSAPASSTATTVKIQGLPSYEKITDKYDGKTFKGASITLSEAEVNGGLTLTSLYTGSGHPSAKLTVTASDTIGGVTSASAPRTLTVNDPPPSASAATASTDGLHGFELGHNAGLDADTAWHVSGAGHDTGLAALLSGGNMGFEHGGSARGDEHNHLGVNIAAFAGHQL
jgi:cysteinyl-tRNA synthetase, unknown class